MTKAELIASTATNAEEAKALARQSMVALDKDWYTRAENFILDDRSVLRVDDTGYRATYSIFDRT